ncbi:FtsX-like permease family protein [Kineosporia mesophila]|uniref:FtsX-like permease family protein n=1 Tax=Kineosporia mesophila TaxID=566012 RepID=UPI002F359BCC
MGLESSLYEAVGAVLGIAIGVPHAWMAFRTLNLGTGLSVSGIRLLQVALLLILVTLLAGLLPARRAIRLSPMMALGSGAA